MPFGATISQLVSKAPQLDPTLRGDVAQTRPMDLRVVEKV